MKVNAPAHREWQDADGIFTPLELRVIALAAATPGDCTIAGPPESWIGRVARRLGRAFALHEPGPLANPHLEALRRVACASFARNGRLDEGETEAALAAGLSRLQIDNLALMATEWRPAHNRRKF
jgi:hypothetical protein